MKLRCFAGALALVLIASTPSRAQDAKPKISDPKLREAVVKFEEASAKLSGGDPEPYIACWSKHEDALELGTEGGYKTKGIAEISKRVKRIAPIIAPRNQGFKNTSEYVSVVETKELAYVVSIERSVALIAEKEEGARPAFRTTLVFRQEDGEWKLILRHSDPLANARTRRPAEKK